MKRLAKRPDKARRAPVVDVIRAHQPQDDNREHDKRQKGDHEQNEADLEQPPADDFQHPRNVASYAASGTARARASARRTVAHSGAQAPGGTLTSVATRQSRGSGSRLGRTEAAPQGRHRPSDRRGGSCIRPSVLPRSGRRRRPGHRLTPRVRPSPPRRSTTRQWRECAHLASARD